VSARGWAKAGHDTTRQAAHRATSIRPRPIYLRRYGSVAWERSQSSSIDHGRLGLEGKLFIAPEMAILIFMDFL
jgi:hypothetical protein